ncbi:hypothetical protein ACLB9X_32340 [Streptomyces sp. 5K101]
MGMQGICLLQAGVNMLDYLLPELYASFCREEHGRIVKATQVLLDKLMPA